MSERSDSATPWMAFLVGIIVVALVVVGFVAFGNSSQQRTAELDDVPDIVNINPPDINVNPPAERDTNIDLPDIEINNPPPANEQPAPAPAP